MKPLMTPRRLSDTATFVLVSVGMMIVALVACLVPARRAVRLDPVAALARRVTCPAKIARAGTFSKAKRFTARPFRTD